MNFDKAFDQLIGNEGGYSFSPSDPGGETMWGVTSTVARANGYSGPMKQLPRETAAAIYRKHYWDVINADVLPAQLRFHIFDAAVNSGPAQAAKWLQHVAGVKEDGIIGAMTISAIAKMDGHEVAMAFTGVRLDFMTSLPTWGAFGRGWSRRIASNLQIKED